MKYYTKIMEDNELPFMKWKFWQIFSHKTIIEVDKIVPNNHIRNLESTKNKKQNENHNLPNIY
jgi:GH25 family lysozyme M1 (1,4-beta-N-acetylmuramidase)